MLTDQRLSKGDGINNFFFRRYDVKDSFGTAISDPQENQNRRL